MKCLRSEIAETHVSKVYIQHILSKLKIYFATSTREMEVVTQFANNAENREISCYNFYN